MDSDAITEAHGMVADLLMSKDSVNDVTHQKLKRVRELLAPRLDKTVTLSPKVYVGVLCVCVCVRTRMRLCVQAVQLYVNEREVGYNN